MQRFGLVIALLLGTPPAAAQEPVDERPADEILVIGERDQDKQVSAFVRALTPSSGARQISRYELTACPAAIGLSERQGAAVVRRMRAVAEAAGLPLADPACEANVLLVVAGDKRAFMERLRIERPDYFPAAWSVDRIRRLVRDPAPAAAWQFEGMINDDGVQMAQRGRGVYYQRTFNRATRLKPNARYHFLASVLVVDARALAGLTTIQLADYAAMRAFARADPAKLNESGAPTILKVIDAPMGTPVPITLSAWDLAFLKSLYATSKGSYATNQRAQIQQGIEKELENRDREPPDQR